MEEAILAGLWSRIGLVSVASAFGPVTPSSVVCGRLRLTIRVGIIIDV